MKIIYRIMLIAVIIGASFTSHAASTNTRKIISKRSPSPQQQQPLLGTQTSSPTSPQQQFTTSTNLPNAEDIIERLAVLGQPNQNVSTSPLTSLTQSSESIYDYAKQYWKPALFGAGAMSLLRPASPTAYGSILSRYAPAAQEYASQLGSNLLSAGQNIYGALSSGAGTLGGLSQEAFRGSTGYSLPVSNEALGGALAVALIAAYNKKRLQDLYKTYVNQENVQSPEGIIWPSVPTHDPNKE